MSFALTFYITAVLGFFASYEFQWSAVTSLAAVVGVVLLASTLVATKILTPVLVVTLVFALDGAILVYVLIWTPTLLSPVFILPALMVLAVFSMAKSVRAASALPFFLAVAIVVVLAPLLTEDPWRLAPAAQGNFISLAIVAVGPLAVLVLLRILKIDPLVTIISATTSLAESHGSPEQSAEKIVKLLVQGEVPAQEGQELVDEIAPAFSSQIAKNDMHAEMYKFKQRFRVRTAGRYLASVFGFVVSAFLVVYVIAWTAMPASLAADWSGVEVSDYPVSVSGLEFALPLTPYVQVSILFALVATAVYLAFCASDEAYLESALSSVASKPAERLVLFALPYFYLKSKEDNT